MPQGKLTSGKRATRSGGAVPFLFISGSKNYSEAIWKEKPVKSGYFLFRILEGRLTIVWVGPEAAAHLLDRCNLDPTFTGCGFVFVILAQAPATSQPGDGSFHDPTDLHRDEARCAFGFPDDHDRVGNFFLA